MTPKQRAKALARIEWISDHIAKYNAERAQWLEALALSDAAPSGPLVPLGRKPERNQAICDAWDAGATMREIADHHGLSYQRVQQILANTGRSGDNRIDQRRRARLAAEDYERLRTHTRQCRVCARWFVAHGKERACSEPCIRAYRACRGDLFSPARYEHHRTYYRDVRPGQAPNRRFFLADAKRVQALIAVGRADLLPGKKAEGLPCLPAVIPKEDLLP